jgi:hypothetical protein
MEEKRYLEIEARTVRFASVNPDARETYQKAFRILLCSIARISDHINNSLS